MTKPFLLKQLLTSLTLPFSAGNLHSATMLFTVLTMAAHFKEIDPHEQENRMLFLSIRMVNGLDHFFAVQWFDGKFVELIIKLSSKSLWVKMSFCIEKMLMCLVRKTFLFTVLHLLIKCLFTKLRTNLNVHQVLL